MDASTLPAIHLTSTRERTAVVAPWGFDMECSYEYDEGEPPTIQYGEFDHPGTPANVALLSCKVGGVDLIDMLSLRQQNHIEESILEQIHE
jgi:hypothetical protein